MYHNKAKEFEAELKKINKTITRIKELKKDTTRYEQIVTSIQKEVESNIDKIYEKYEINANALFYDLIKQEYDKGLTVLSQLNERLKQEYDELYKIKNMYHQLSTEISLCVNEFDIKKNINTIIQLLNLLRESNDIDYDYERDIVESSYQLAYKLIKQELANLGTDTLLYYIQTFDIDTQYIDSCIDKEINENLNLKNNKEILRLINSIKAKGLDANYLNRELILLIHKIVTSTNDTSLQKSIKTTPKEEFMLTYNEILQLETEFKNSMAKVDIDCLKYKEKTIQKSKLRKKYIKRKIYKGIFLATTAAVLVGAYNPLKKITSADGYKTYKTTYSVNSDQLVTEKPYYAKEQADSVIITTYTPWDKNSILDENYTRNVYIYDVSNIELETLKDYTKLDFTTLGAPTAHDTEKKKNLDLEDLYYQNITTITKIIQDKNLQKPIPNNYLMLIIYITFLLLTLKIIQLDAKKTEKIIKNNEKLIEELENLKKSLLLTTKEFQIITNKLFTVTTNSLDMYDQLLIYDKSSPEIRQGIAKVRNLRDEIRSKEVEDHLKLND